MSGKPRYTVAQVADALRRARGLQSLAAAHLGCDRGTLRRYVQRYPSLQEVIAEQREQLIDRAEGVIHSAVLSGDFQAAKWILATLGRDRGYGERQAVEHEGAVTLRVVYEQYEEPVERG